MTSTATRFNARAERAYFNHRAACANFEREKNRMRAAPKRMSSTMARSPCMSVSTSQYEREKMPRNSSSIAYQYTLVFSAVGKPVYIRNGKVWFAKGND